MYSKTHHYNTPYSLCAIVVGIGKKFALLYKPYNFLTNQFLLHEKQEQIFYYAQTAVTSPGINKRHSAC